MVKARKVFMPLDENDLSFAVQFVDHKGYGTDRAIIRTSRRCTPKQHSRILAMAVADRSASAKPFRSRSVSSKETTFVRYPTFSHHFQRQRSRRPEETLHFYGLIGNSTWFFPESAVKPCFEKPQAESG